MASTFAHVLKNRAFRDLWLGQAISQLGDAFYYLIFMFMVKKITGSNVMVGIVGAAETLPYLLLGPYAGVFADRVDRRKIMLYSDVACFVILGLFALYLVAFPVPHTPMLVIVPFFLSCIRVFFLPAKGGALPRLVPAEDMQTANGLSMTTQSVVPLIGMAFTATVMGVIYNLSKDYFFLIAVCLNAISFIWSAYFVRRLPPVEPERDKEPGHPIAEIKDGFQFIKTRRDLSMLVLLSGLINLALSPFYVFYVASNELWFGGTPTTLAWIEFSFFVGMVAGSIWVSHVRVSRPGMSYIWAMAGVGITVIAMAFFPILLPFMLWNIAAGIILPFGQVPMSTYLQLSVVDAFRGRVNSALSMVTTGLAPIGLAAGGFLVDAVGVFNGYVVMGAAMGIFGFLGLIEPKFRGMKMPESVSQTAS